MYNTGFVTNRPSMNANLYAALQTPFLEHAERVAVVTDDDREYSYADMDSESGRIARTLRELAEPGDRVVVQVEKSVYALCLYLACLRAGLIYIPLNTAYTWREVAYFLGDSEAAVFVTSSAVHEQTADASRDAGVRHHLSLDPDGAGTLRAGRRDDGDGHAVIHSDAGDIATILYTSGTTGRAKGAMLTHKNLVANAHMLHTAWDWRDDDILLHVLPIFHVHGLFVACHTAWLSGSTMIFLSRPSVDDIIRRLPAATVMMGVPTHYVRLAADPRLDAALCASIRVFISGSAPLLTQTFEAFKTKTGHEIVERYGMTETVINTSNPVHGPRKPGTVGLPFPGVEYKIIDAEHAAVAPGEIGLLAVKGPNVFKGYWRNPEKTASEFTEDGYFITGDLASVDADGYISIVGRDKDLIISGGYNVYPKEVEQVIDAVPGVKESAVIGLKHPEFGEAVTAVVVPRSEALKASDVTAHLKGELAPYKVPKAVHLVDELPRNAMGKVLKHVLRRQFSPDAPAP